MRSFAAGRGPSLLRLDRGFALVGGEVAWALRPFVGSVYKPVVFLRADALDGNVYEFIFTEILPHLLSGDSKGGESMDARQPGGATEAWSPPIRRLLKHPAEPRSG